jgi:hypothetical protein
LLGEPALIGITLVAITQKSRANRTVLHNPEQASKKEKHLKAFDGADYGSLARTLENSKATVTQLSNVIVKSKSLGRGRKKIGIEKGLNLHISTLTAYLEIVTRRPRFGCGQRSIHVSRVCKKVVVLWWCRGGASQAAVVPTGRATQA